MNWKEIVDKTNLAQAGEEKGYRDEFLNKAIVDVVQRGNDINVIVYVVPGVNPYAIVGAVKKTCIDIFGHKRSEQIEPIFYPKGVGIHTGWGDDTYDSFCLVVKHPLSLRYTLQLLRDEFTNRLYFHL